MSQHPAHLNATLYDYPWLCTVDTYPLSWASMQYVPSLGGNVTYEVIFSLLLVFQIWFGFLYRTWGFLTGMFFGILLEFIGYFGRIKLSQNPFGGLYFLM